MKNEYSGSRNTGNNSRDQEDIKKTPEERVREEFSMDQQTVKIILTPQEVAKMNGEFPFLRTVLREVNGELIEEIQELYRFDAIGRIVRNDDVVGISWTGLLIPQDCISSCLNPFGDHRNYLVFLEVDGFVTDKGNILCQACLERQEQRISLRNWLLWGLLYNPEIY